MSLTVANTLAQQQAIQSQIAAAQTSAPSTTSSSDSTAATSSATASNPAAALIAGNATLTSDLLSVLLNEQSAATTGSKGGHLTLAGMLEQQDAASGKDPTSLNQSATSTGNVMNGLQSLLNQLSF